MLSSVFPLQRRIVTLVVVLLLVGHMMLFSATGIMGLQRYGSEFYYVLRQAICTAAGLTLMFLLSRIKYQAWAKLAVPLMAIQIFLLLLTYISSLGPNIQGASRWLRLGPLQFQPSELAKITLSIYLAALFARYESRKPLPKTWATHAIIIGLLLLAIFRQPDLGTTLLLASIILGMFFISGIRVKTLLTIVAPVIGFAVVAILGSEYRRKRLFAFLNPWADPQGSGFQAIQSFLSFHSGKLFGVGLGNGNSKLFFLPEVHTDFIFALVGEELGFVGVAAIILLFVYFAYLLLKVSFVAPDAFGRYLSFGLTLSLLLQVAVNLGGVAGLLPVKGLPLPFISWGRSALLANLCVVGILLNIVRQSAIIHGKPTTSG